MSTNELISGGIIKACNVEYLMWGEPQQNDELKLNPQAKNSEMSTT